MTYALCICVIKNCACKSDRTICTCYVFACGRVAQVSRHATLLATIMQQIRDEGSYNMYAKLMDSAKFGGVPQHRPRLFILGILKTVDKGTFEWPHEYEHPGLESILEPAASKPIEIPPSTQTTARTNLLAGLKAIQKQKLNPRKEPCILDIDSTNMNWRHDESLCLTRSRGSSGGYYVSNRGRRLTTNEQCRLQAYDPNRIIATCISQRQLCMAIGNAMTVSVVERIFARALPAAGLASTDGLKFRWESKTDAKRTLSTMC